MGWVCFYFKSLTWRHYSGGFGKFQCHSWWFTTKGYYYTQLNGLSMFCICVIFKVVLTELIQYRTDNMSLSQCTLAAMPLYYNAW